MQSKRSTRASSTHRSRVSVRTTDFQLESGPLEQFEANSRDLLAALEKLDREYPAAAGPSSGPQGAFSPAARRAALLAAIVESFNAKGPYRVSVDDVATLLALGDAKTRFAIAENGLAALREIYREGVYDSGSNLTPRTPDSVALFRVRRPTGEVAQVRVQSMEEALNFLRINFAAEGVRRGGDARAFPPLQQRSDAKPDLRPRGDRSACSSRRSPTSGRSSFRSSAARRSSSPARASPRNSTRCSWPTATFSCTTATSPATRACSCSAASSWCSRW